MAKVTYIIGVAGSGKSTIGRAYAAASGLPFYDGDDFHPPANVAKMSAGQPLNDEDRWGWLEAIHQFVQAQLQHGQSLVLACSALKHSYRQQLSAGIQSQVVWVYLEGGFELIRKRMETRAGHFMPPNLLQSQFDALEPPAGAITLDICYPPEMLVQRLRDQIEK